jgi:hypothetical protein
MDCLRLRGADCGGGGDVDGVLASTDDSSEESGESSKKRRGRCRLTRAADRGMSSSLLSESRVMQSTWK